MKKTTYYPLFLSILFLLFIFSGCKKSGNQGFQEGVSGEEGRGRPNSPQTRGTGGTGGAREGDREGASGEGGGRVASCESIRNEVCDGADNDCDGNIDEGYVVEEEVCDGMDNDCDGLEDESQVCDIIDFSARYSHVCVVLANNRVKCWGDACDGKLGNAPGYNQGCLNAPLRRNVGDEVGEMDEGLPYVSLGNFSVIDVETGGTHTCAISSAGAVKCWGDGFSGQLGYESDDSTGSFASEMGSNLSPVDIGLNRDDEPYQIYSMSLGGGHSCALIEAWTAFQPDLARVKCWGRNLLQELGQGETPSTKIGDEEDEMGDELDFSNFGEDQNGFFPIVDIEARDSLTCVRLENRAKCVGFNVANVFATSMNGGLTGDRTGNDLDFAELTENNMPEEVHSFQPGSSHGCAIVGDGRVKCWGENDFGQLGDGTTRDFEEDFEFLEYVDFGTDDNGIPLRATQLTVGDDHSCVVLEGAGLPPGQIKCWGKNDLGQLGYEIDVMQVPEDDRPAAMNKGDDLGEMGNALPFINLGTDAEVVRVEAGRSFTCALLSSGDLKCWGRNDLGQLGQSHQNNLGDNEGEMGDALLPILY